MTTIMCGGTKVITDDGRVFDLPKKPGESIHIPGPGNLRVMTPEEIEHREKTCPRSYDLSLQEDRDRLLRETAGYAKVSLHHGTDDDGRRYASEALDRALRMGFRLVPPSVT